MHALLRRAAIVASASAVAVGGLAAPAMADGHSGHGTDQHSSYSKHDHHKKYDGHGKWDHRSRYDNEGHRVYDKRHDDSTRDGYYYDSHQHAWKNAYNHDRYENGTVIIIVFVQVYYDQDHYCWQEQHRYA